MDPRYPNLGVWTQNLKNKSQQKIQDFHNFEIFGCFVSLCNFLRLFLVFLGGFHWFQFFLAGFGSLQLVLGFIKYEIFVVIFLLPINCLISFGKFSTPNHTMLHHDYLHRYSLSSYWFILIMINYVCLILYSR